MNNQIQQLAIECAGQLDWNTPSEPTSFTFTPDELEKFAQLIVEECSRCNKAQSYELLGVIADVEADNGFDKVCLNTVKWVHQYLSGDALTKHFGVEE